MGRYDLVWAVAFTSYFDRAQLAMPGEIMRDPEAAKAYIAECGRVCRKAADLTAEQSLPPELP